MNRKIAVVGLGYVGLPVAVTFGKQDKIIGFDINEKRIETLKNNTDYTNEVSDEDLEKSQIEFTSNPEKLKEADFIIIAVPTPIDEHNQPNLTPLVEASKTVGKAMSPGTIVVYESTVYPGVTEDECAPVLEEYSGLKAGKDFFVGYSPERINPGDKEHTFETITKVVSGQDQETLDTVAEVYSSVVKAGVFKASSIKVAEASKVIENTQRDINIALMNEFAKIFNKLDIDTNEVLKAAGTKWNFLNFKPGLVGGHCIGVDPYYLTYKAQELGYHPEVILSGRRINDDMGKHVATTIVKELLKKLNSVQDIHITVLGLTFKENTPDLRNTKVIDIINELKEYGIQVNVNDVYGDKEEAKKFYDIDLIDKDQLPKSDAIVFAVPHQDYKDNKAQYLNQLEDNGIVFDIKDVVYPEDLKAEQSLWRL